MHIEYLSKEIYNTASRVNRDTFPERIARLKERYKSFNKKQLLEKLAYKIDEIEFLNGGCEWRSDVIKAKDSIIRIQDRKISNLEEELGKKAEFVNRNKKPATLIQFK